MKEDTSDIGYLQDIDDINDINDGDDDNIKFAKKGTIQMGLLGCFFFLLFFSYNTTQNFETTLNDTLGFYSLSILYFCFSFSNLFSSIIVRKCGIKISLLIGGSAYTLYIAANIIPTAYILIPCSAVIGVGAAILWNAQGVLLARVSIPSTIDFNSGLFFSIFMLNLIFGNLFAAVFLSFGLDTRLLFVCLTVIAVVATLSFLIIKPPVRENIDVEVKKDPSLFEVLLIFKNRTFQLMICISIYSGLTQSLFYGSFTGLIGDTILIGYVMSLFGVFDCIGSFSNGWIANKFGKRSVIILGSISAVIGFVSSTIASYPPENSYGETNIWIYYFTAVFFGYADSAYNTQIYAILSVYFTDNAEPYFAGFKMLQASSTAAAFFYSPYVPFPILVLITAFFMVIGLIFLFVLDRWISPIDLPKKRLNSKK